MSTSDIHVWSTVDVWMWPPIGCARRRGQDYRIFPDMKVRGRRRRNRQAHKAFEDWT